MGRQTRKKCYGCQEMKWPNSFNSAPNLCFQCFREMNAPKKREIECLSCSKIKTIPVPNRTCNECKKSLDYSEGIFTQEYAVRL